MPFSNHILYHSYKMIYNRLNRQKVVKVWPVQVLVCSHIYCYCHVAPLRLSAVIESYQRGSNSSTFYNLFTHKTVSMSSDLILPTFLYDSPRIRALIFPYSCFLVRNWRFEGGGVEIHQLDVKVVEVKFYNN